MSYKLLTNHLILFSLCLWWFLPRVQISFHQQPSTLEKNKHSHAFMLRLQIVKPVLTHHIFYKSFEAIDTIFPFLLLVALETSAQGCSINSLGVHDLGHTHSLLCLQWLGLSDQ